MILLKQVRSALLLIICAFIVGGCASPPEGAAVKIGKTYPPRPADFPIEIFTSGQPSRPFERVAIIHSHREIHDDLSWRLEEMIPILKQEARAVGADAVIEIHKRTIRDMAVTYDVSGVAIRYTDSESKPLSGS
jgi:hypothetical protein